MRLRVQFSTAEEGREPSGARLEMARGLFAKPDLMSHFSLTGSTLGSVPGPRFESTRIWQVKMSSLRALRSREP